MIDDVDLNNKLMNTVYKDTPFKISPLKDPAAHMLYVQKMVKEIEEKNIEKRKVSTVQQPSTQRLLSMGPDELEKYQKRALPTKRDAAANPDAEDIQSQHKGGDIAVHYAESARERPKNSQGQTEGSAFAHRKDEAIKGFLSTDAELLPIQKHMVKADPRRYIGIYTLEQKPRPWWRRMLGIRWVWSWKDDAEDEWIWRLRK